MILKFTFRNLTKRPFLNLVKILGLAFSLTGLIVIALFIKNELSYDHFHKKADRIYRFTFTSESFFGGNHFARIPNAIIIPQMAEYFVEIENYTRLARIGESYIKYGEEFINVNQAFYCDSTFFEVFDCNLLIGNPNKILDNPGNMIISESFAEKVFKGSDPIGQILTIPSGQFNNEKEDYIVKGIMKDYPKNSHFHPDYITSPKDKLALDGWAWSYFLLSENPKPETIISGFADFGSSTWGVERSEITMQAHLQNVKDIHLHSHKLREIEPNGNMNVLYTLSIAAIILLFIALINFTNLNIGMAGFSDKFIFVNKLSGASGSISFRNYLSEGLIVILIAIILSVGFTAFANSTIQNHFGIDYFHGNKFTILIIVLGFVVLCMLASVAPIFKEVSKKIKSGLDIKRLNNIQRKGISKGLIVLQYTITIALLVSVFVILLQTNYALNSGIGADSKNLICFENVHSNVQADFQVFKEELLKYESIESVTAMFEPPGGETNDMFPFEMEGLNQDESEGNNLIGVFPCDHSFIDVFRLNLLSGKTFSDKVEDNDGNGEYIINESAMKRLGYTAPEEIVGKQFKLSFFDESIVLPKGKIIGVVKDFHFSSIKKEIQPLVFFKRKNIWISNFIVSVKNTKKKEALAAVKTVWNKLYPFYPFDYQYLNSVYGKVYQSEILQSRLIALFTLISLFICSMGLLGMSLLVTQKRTKEIGIRKVNGAKELQIVFMLNWDLLKWILLSFFLSVPIAYYTMDKWLENFAYKVSLSWWIFALAGLIALVVSLLTVTTVSWNAAQSNPVKALRYE